MSPTLVQCRRRLAVIWFAAAALILLILLLQTLVGNFDPAYVQRAWSWFFPSVMPTLLLMFGVLVTDAATAATGTNVSAPADPFLFRLTIGISLVYLGILLLVLLAQPMAGGTSQSRIATLNQSEYFLGPFQGLVAASMGAFFLKRKEHGEAG